MIKKNISVEELVAFLGGAVIRVEGQVLNRYIDQLADANHVDETTLDWVKSTNPNKQCIVEHSHARVILVDEDVVYSDCIRDDGKTLIKVNNPKMAIALVGNHYFVQRTASGIHPTAVIDNDAKISENVTIGAYCVIGKASIGEGTIIDSNVRVYDDVIIGRNCDIKAGAVLGGAGFGFETDAEGNKFRFPQIGRLIIGDDVEIGANTCIDRGALSDTVIGDHTKINNLCHIAHNNIIGCNVTITGCVNVSGSNVIEDNVWIAPNATVRGFIHLGEGCILGMGSVATKNIPAHETWVGNPARKMEKI